MKKSELFEELKKREYKLLRHDMGERTIRRWKYVDGELVCRKHIHRRIEYAVQFKGEDFQYKINKQEYAKLYDTNTKNN
jgi:hypothetical protein